MTYYFPQSEEVYESHSTASILRMFDRCTTLYLYEPKDKLEEPFYAASGARPVQIIATYSPDERRYKEFKKSGMIKFYMPCWTLNELQAVGAYMDSTYHEKLEVDFSPEAISDRFKRFGGIFRYVLPCSKLSLLQAKRDQLAVLSHTTLMDAYAPYGNIEKTDNRNTNISHFVLQKMTFPHQILLPFMHKCSRLIKLTLNCKQFKLLGKTVILNTKQYVTRFAKTQHNDAFLEIQIFASMNSIYLKLCSVVISMLNCKYFSRHKAR